MIIDSHAHIFPPSVIARRATLLATEPAFAEIYSDANAKMAITPESVIRREIRPKLPEHEN